MTVEDVARICHEANNAYCEVIGEKPQPPWDKAKKNIQESAKDGVRFHMANPTAGPKGSHQNWLKFKEADGWTYGEKKNATKKTHPCMVPYEKLPAKQRVKDEIFCGIVKALAPFTTPEPQA